VSEPTSVTPGQITPDHRELIEEQKAIIEGIANVTLAWGGVESALVTILFTVLGADDLHKQHIASAMYFSLSSLEARIGIVNAAVGQIYVGHQLEKGFSAEWKCAIARINRLKKTRNIVAHGTIMTISAFSPEGKSRVRLMAPMLNLKSTTAAFSNLPQIPGLGSNELSEAVRATGEATQRLFEFPALIRMLSDPAAQPTLREKLIQLEAIRKQSPPEADPNREAP
jgi:hypothetical protein